jgi:hypothetical protein
MIVGSCFQGDNDMLLAGVQHDFYFVCETRPQVAVDRYGTLGWIWHIVMCQCQGAHRHVPWIARNRDRLLAIDGFNHKLLQAPHEHIAAYYRWTMPRVRRRVVVHEAGKPYPYDVVDQWRAYLRRDIPELLAAPEATVALAKLILYRNFDASDAARDAFHRILFERYGYACVAKTWWAAETAARVGFMRPGSGVAA